MGEAFFRGGWASILPQERQTRVDKKMAIFYQLSYKCDGHKQKPGFPKEKPGMISVDFIWQPALILCKINGKEP